VFDLHRIYSDQATRDWAAAGCRSAGIGCLECKQPLIEKVVAEISDIRERAREFEENPELVDNIVAEGAQKARDAARATLDEVRRAMNLQP
jgi:tryptophanyl-tRNA synthetase